MTKKLLLETSSAWLVLSIIACSSDPSTGQNGGVGGIGTSLGGTSSVTVTSTTNTGGNANASGGNSSNNVGGKTGVGGSSAANAGGTAASTGGKSANGGASAANTGGTKGPDATSAGGTVTTSTGGKSGAAGGAPAGGAGGKSAATGGAAAGGGGGKSSAGGDSSVVSTGGNANGGATQGVGGGTAGSAPTGAQLITSAQSDYFNTTHEATVVTSGTPDITIDEGTEYQRWDGFGGTFNEMGWDALSVLTQDEITNAMTLLFDPDKGANFIYGRIPMGASDYASSWYTYSDGNADYSMTNFSIARDEQKLIPFIKAALAIRSDIRLWGSPWVVPSWMMDSGSNMNLDSKTLTAHALYMAKFVEEYAKKGLTIWAVHPQNEPGYGRVHWKDTANLVNFMKTYLGPMFEERKLTAEIWCGTMSKDPDDTNIALAAAKDPDAMKYIKGFGVQWNPLAAVPTLAAKGPVMQTEHRCGNYNFDSDYWKQSQYNSSKAQNDHAYGEESWQLIRDWVFAGVNSYSAWNMVLDTNGKSLDGWPQNALLVVDKTQRRLIQTPAYYVFRQFGQFVLPGAKRIGATTSNTALKGLATQTWNGWNVMAFKNADGSIVTEVYNKGSSALTLTVKVGSTLYQISVPAHGWDTLNVR